MDQNSETQYVCFAEEHQEVLWSFSSTVFPVFAFGSKPHITDRKAIWVPWLFLVLFYSIVAGVVSCGGRKKSPVHHHGAGYILFPLESLSSSWLFWKSNTAFEYRLSWRKGAYAASQTTVLHMKRLHQNESPNFVVLCSLFPKAILFYFYFTLL